MSNKISEKDLRHFSFIVTQAAGGAKIQVRERKNTSKLDWVDKEDLGIWYPDTNEYRVKPPEPREIWINIFSGSPRAFMKEDEAYKAVSPNFKYDGIAVHFKEVIENDSIESGTYPTRYE